MTGVQTCALPIYLGANLERSRHGRLARRRGRSEELRVLRIKRGPGRAAANGDMPRGEEASGDEKRNESGAQVEGGDHDCAQDRRIAKLLTYSSAFDGSNTLPMTLNVFVVVVGGVRPASFINRAASVARNTCLATAW